MTESDRIQQLENEVAILKDNLLNYICQATQKDHNPQWTNARLERLEDQVRVLEERQNPEKYNAS